MFPMLRIALLFLVLIAYGSLYPFDTWSTPAAPLFRFLWHWPAVLTRADLVQNVLAYAPFGLFYALHRLQREACAAAPGPSALRRTVGAAFLLSLTMESLQQFEPARTASLADIAMNVLGALAGAMLASTIEQRRRPASAGWPWRQLHRLHRWRERRFRTGLLPNIGLAAVALWALAETSPLAPVFDPAYLARKLAMLAWQVQHPLRIGLAHTLVTACQLAGLGCLLRTLVRPAGVVGHKADAPHADQLFAMLLATVFTIKLLVLGRYLYVAELAGAALALVVLYTLRGDAAGRRAAAMRRPGVRGAAIAGAVALLAGFVLAELLPGRGPHHDFNWVPLAGQLRSLAGMENILELFWPFFALAYLARLLTAPARRQQVGWLGGLLVLTLVFQLEWMQQDLAGRYGDITQVLLALGGWLLPWSFRGADFAAPAGADANRPAPAGDHVNAQRRASMTSSW